MAYSQELIDQMVAQTEAVFTAINNEETESEMTTSSGHGDPEFMGWSEVMFSDERNRLFRRLKTVIVKQMIIKDRFGSDQFCPLESEGSEAGHCQCDQCYSSEDSWRSRSRAGSQ